MNRKKVAVGLSGGVDSAVSALLLKKQGFDVVGVHLYCWPPKSVIEKDGVSRAEWMKKNGCRADEDKSMALRTALEIDIPFKMLDFSEEYNKRVVDYFYTEYEAGRTPNPDVLCNSEIKFGLFLEWALKSGFDYVATGHYAKIRENDGEFRMYRPKDKHKDQTYFLWKLTQNELAHVLFPLSDLEKYKVRIIAKEEELSVASRKDSQGICFIGPVDVKEFLGRRLKAKRGDVLDKQGRKLGTHEGIWKYTIGERGGWKIDPRIQHEMMKDGETPILYVVDKDAKKNVLVVARAVDAVSGDFLVEDINDISGDLEEETNALVRIRHGGELLESDLKWVNKLVEVKLDKKIRGLASGQSAVFYGKDGEVLGGGVIK